MESEESGFSETRERKRKIDPSIADCTPRRASKRKRQASIKGREAGIAGSLYKSHEPSGINPAIPVDSSLRLAHASSLLESVNAPNSPPHSPPFVVSKTAQESRVQISDEGSNGKPTSSDSVASPHLTRPAILEVHFFSEKDKNRSASHAIVENGVLATGCTSTTCSTSTLNSTEQPASEEAFAGKTANPICYTSAFHPEEGPSEERLQEEEEDPSSREHPIEPRGRFELGTNSAAVMETQQRTTTATPTTRKASLPPKVYSTIFVVALLMLPLLAPQFLMKMSWLEYINLLQNTFHDPSWQQGMVESQTTQKSNAGEEARLVKIMKELQRSLREKEVVDQKLLNNTIAFEEAASQLEAHKKELAEEKAEKEAILRELELRGSQLGVVHANLADSRKRVKELSVRNVELESKMEAWSASQVQEQLNDRSEEHKDLENQKNQLRIELESLSQQLNEVRSDHSNAQKSLEESDSERELLNEELNQLKGCMGKLENEIVETQQRLKQTREDKGAVFRQLTRVLTEFHETVDVISGHNNSPSGQGGQDELMAIREEVEHWRSVYQSIQIDSDAEHTEPYNQKLLALHNLLLTKGKEMAQTQTHLRNALVQKDEEIRRVREEYRQARAKADTLSAELQSRNTARMSRGASLPPATRLGQELEEAWLELKELNDYLDAQEVAASRALNSAITAVYKYKEEEAARAVNYVTGEASNAISDAESRVLNDAIEAMVNDGSPDIVTEVVHLVSDYLNELQQQQ